jgi:cellulose synthase (UDP-forming)
VLPPEAELPAELDLVVDGEPPLRLRARRVWCERVGRTTRAGVAFADPGPDARRALARAIFSGDGAFAGAHAERARTQVGMALRLVAGLVGAFLPLRARRRAAPRRRAFRPVVLVEDGGRARAAVVDVSTGGMGLVLLGRSPAVGETLPLLAPDGVRWARVVHARRLLPGLWRAGLSFVAAPVAGERPHAYLAA